MKKATQLVTLTLYVCVAFIAAILLIYIFFGLQYQDRWVGFGTFFSGVVSPIIAFANLIIFGLISYQLADREDQRSINILRFEAVANIDRLLRKIPSPLNQKGIYAERFFPAFYKFRDGYSHYSHLFPDQEKEYEKLRTVLERLKHLTTLHYGTQIRDPEADTSEILEEMAKCWLHEFLTERQSFISVLRAVLPRPRS